MPWPKMASVKPARAAMPLVSGPATLSWPVVFKTASPGKAATAELGGMGVLCAMPPQTGVETAR